MLDDERYRGEIIGRATAPLSAAGAVWLVAELGRLIVAAAHSPPRFRSAGWACTTTVDFALGTAAGRAGTALRRGSCGGVRGHGRARRGPRRSTSSWPGWPRWA